MLAKTFKGLEQVLAKELVELGANNVQIERRAVSFTGDLRMLYTANFCLRTASRVLVHRELLYQIYYFLIVQAFHHQ